MKKIFSVLLACVLVGTVGVGSALALTVNISTSNPPIDSNNITRNDEINYVGGYIYLPSGSNFTVTFVASDYQGSINWTDNSGVDDWTQESYNIFVNNGSFDSDYYRDNVYNNNLSGFSISRTDNSITFSGVLSPNSYECILKAYAYTSGARYTTDFGLGSVAIANSDYLGPDATPIMSPITGDGGSENPSSGSDDGSYSIDSPSKELLPGNIRSVQPSNLEEGVLENIAASENIPVDRIKFLTDEDIDTETYEPTDEMRQQASDESLEYAAKLNTVTFKESGYYLFEVDFPKELEGMSVNDIRLQFADASKVKGDSTKSAFLELMADRFLAGSELRTMLGEVTDTVPGQALLLMMANSGGSFTMYALKMILMLLGGCNAGVAPYIGWGVAGLLSLSGGLAFRKFFRKNKNKK